MNTHIKNILHNVLVSAGGNKFQLCDIHFDSKIREIKPKSEKLFDWIDLSNKEKKNSLLKNYTTRKENDFLLAIPGGIDSHVHFDTPGFEFREDFAHASQAALYGGTTTIIDMPCTSIPPVTSVKNLKEKLRFVKDHSYIDYFFWGGVSGSNFDEKEIEKNVNELSDAGVVGFKVYMISGMETYSDLSDYQLEVLAKIIAKTGKPMAVHAEDKEMIVFREKRFKSLNHTDWHAYCESRDIQAEASAVNKLIHIAEKTNCRIHIVHISSALSLKAIMNVRVKGIPITTETCPHYLYFTQKDFQNEGIRNFLKTAPPVKFEEDKEALWHALENGAISFVTTDHAGCDPSKEKSSQNFWEVYGGIPGVEHRVPFLFSEGFLKNKITLQKTVELLSSNVSDYFHLKHKGNLKIGEDADITLINLWKKQIIKSGEMHSKGKYTPFENVELNACVEAVYLRGIKLLEGKNCVKQFNGQFIRNN